MILLNHFILIVVLNCISFTATAQSNGLGGGSEVSMQCEQFKLYKEKLTKIISQNLPQETKWKNNMSSDINDIYELFNRIMLAKSLKKLDAETYEGLKEKCGSEKIENIRDEYEWFFSREVYNILSNMEWELNAALPFGCGKANWKDFNQYIEVYYIWISDKVKDYKKQNSEEKDPNKTNKVVPTKDLKQFQGFKG